MKVSFSFTRGRLITHRVLMRHEFPAWPMMAIDTGARMTVVTPRTAEELGFELGDIEPSTSILAGTRRRPLRSAASDG